MLDDAREGERVQGGACFFGQYTASVAASGFTLAEKISEKCKKLLTCASGCSIVDISKGTRGKSFTLRIAQIRHSKPELSGGKQDDLIPL